MSSSDPSLSPRWTHEPQRGPVAWGAAVLVVPVVPLLALLTLMACLGVGADDTDLVVLATPLPWAAVGLALLLAARRRIVRGIGAGLVAGGASCLLLAVLAVNGGG